MDVSLITQPPGTATPLHVHSREAEAFYVLEGTLLYRAGYELHELVAGSFIHLPPGVPHAFRITGSTPVRFLGLVSPAGLMDLYDEVGLPALERRLPGVDGRTVAEEIPPLERDRCPLRPHGGRCAYSRTARELSRAYDSPWLHSTRRDPPRREALR